VKWVFGLVGVAALLFLVGGVGTIASFITHADGARQVFMYVFLAGLVPTMVLLVFSLGIAIYHLYLNRVAGRTPSGWFASDKKSDHE
jgi:hypothetical protein